MPRKFLPHGLWSAGCVLLLLSCRPLAAAETAGPAIMPVPPQADLRVATVQVQVSPDHGDWTYRTGDPVRFHVMVTADNTPLDQVPVTVRVGPEQFEGVARSVVVPAAGLEIDGGTMIQPGFLRCIVETEVAGHPYRGLATAAFSPEKIKPHQTDPEDFDAFWADGLAQLAKVPMEPRLTLLPDACTDKINVYHVSFRTVGPDWTPVPARIYGILCEGELNHYFLEVFNGILAAAAQHEQNTTVFSLHDWAEAPQRLGRFCDGRIDGMILVGPPFRADKVPLPAHTPFVSIHANHPLPGVVNIESDEERGAYELVRHGLALGHRRIMHITGPHSDVGVRRRIRGYKRALAAAGVDFDPALLVPAQYRSEAGRDALRAWLDARRSRSLPQMIFCGSDAIALGCLEVLAECGLRVPDDVSVAGFDDTLAARITMPQLTSVRQPLSEMGRKAVDILLTQIDPRADEPVPAKPLVFPTTVVLRASLAMPRIESAGCI